MTCTATIHLFHQTAYVIDASCSGNLHQRVLVEQALPALPDPPGQENESSLSTIARNYTPDNYHLTPQILHLSTQSCLSTYSPEFTLNEIPLPVNGDSFSRQHYQLYGCDNSPMNEAIFVVDERRAYRDL